MTGIALQAAQIVDQIRLQEQQTLWSKDYEESLTEEGGIIFPGMMFTLAKERIERSQLFRIVQRMPKGALLHCHLEAMVDFRYILEDAFELCDIYFKSSESLSTSEARSNATIGFTSINSNPQPLGTSVWSLDYQPGTPVPLNVAAETFPAGGKAAFISWMASRCSITLSESLRHHDGPHEVWKKFFSSFSIIRTIIYHPPIFKSYIRRLCQQLHSDGIEWVDVRGIFYNPALDVDKQQFVELIGMLGDEVEAFKNSKEGAGFWGMRVIWTWARMFSNQSILYG